MLDALLPKPHSFTLHISLFAPNFPHFKCKIFFSFFLLFTSSAGSHPTRGGRHSKSRGVETHWTNLLQTDEQEKDKSRMKSESRKKKSELYEGKLPDPISQAFVQATSESRLLDREWQSCCLPDRWNLSLRDCWILGLHECSSAHDERSQVPESAQCSDIRCRQPSNS